MVDQIEAQVTAGTLTKAQADGDRGAPGQGRRAAVRARRRPGGRRRPGHARTAARAAGRSPSTPPRRYIGITAAELRTQLDAGKTLAAIADGQRQDGRRPQGGADDGGQEGSRRRRRRPAGSRRPRRTRSSRTCPRASTTRSTRCTRAARRPRRPRRPAAGRLRRVPVHRLTPAGSSLDAPASLRAPAGHAPPGLGAFGRLARKGAPC